MLLDLLQTCKVYGEHWKIAEHLENSQISPFTQRFPCFSIAQYVSSVGIPLILHVVEVQQSSQGSVKVVEEFHISEMSYGFFHLHLNVRFLHAGKGMIARRFCSVCLIGPMSHSSNM